MENSVTQFSMVNCFCKVMESGLFWANREWHMVIKIDLKIHFSFGCLVCFEFKFGWNSVLRQIISKQCFCNDLKNKYISPNATNLVVLYLFHWSFVFKFKLLYHEKSTLPFFGDDSVQHHHCFCWKNEFLPSFCKVGRTVWWLQCLERQRDFRIVR